MSSKEKQLKLMHSHCAQTRASEARGVDMGRALWSAAMISLKAIKIDPECESDLGFSVEELRSSVKYHTYMMHSPRLLARRIAKLHVESDRRIEKIRASR